MRKILLGTTAVVGAALLSTGAFAQSPITTAPAGSAPDISIAPGSPIQTPVTQAPTPRLAGAGGLTIRLGGYFAFTGAYVQDDNDYARTRNSQQGANNRNARSRYDFRNDLELNVFVDGRASNGMTYGAQMEFQMDNGTGTAGDNSNVSMDEAWGFLSFPNLGTLQFGAQDSAANQLQVRAPAAGALGGDAEWDEFIVNTGLFSSPYILSGINDGNDATKIIYLSPQFAGFDFGASFAPNAGEGERTNLSNGVAQRDRTTIENELSAGIRYRGTFGPVGLSASVGGMWANPEKLTAAGQLIVPQNQSVNAYFLGAAIQAYGFSFGAEYAFGQYNGSSVGRSPLAPGLDDSSHYLIGTTYTMGALVFGAVFGQGFQDNGVAVTRAPNQVITSVRSVEDRTHTLWGVGVLYNLAPGLGLFLSYNNINDENIPTSGGPSNGLYGGSGTSLASFNGSNTRTINIGVAGIRMAF